MSPPARAHAKKRKFDQTLDDLQYLSSRWPNSEQETHSQMYKFDDRTATPIVFTHDDQNNATAFDLPTQNPFVDQHEQTMFPSESMNDEHTPAIQSNGLKVLYGSVRRTHSSTAVKQTKKKKNSYGGVDVYEFDEHRQLYACSHCSFLVVCLTEPCGPSDCWYTHAYQPIQTGTSLTR